MTPTQTTNNVDPVIQGLRNDAPSSIRDEIARLAYDLWEQDDQPARSPEDYWLEAERRLGRKTGSLS
jgi:Protein of unknown function (DUF2934)